MTTSTNFHQIARVTVTRLETCSALIMSGDGNTVRVFLPHNAAVAMAEAYRAATDEVTE